MVPPTVEVKIYILTFCAMVTPIFCLGLLISRFLLWLFANDRKA